MKPLPEIVVPTLPEMLRLNLSLSSTPLTTSVPAPTPSAAPNLLFAASVSRPAPYLMKRAPILATRLPMSRSPSPAKMPVPGENDDRAVATDGIMTPRMIRIAVAFLAVLAPLRAEWTFSNKETLAAPAGLGFFRCVATDGNRRVDLHVVGFSAKAHTFAVMDNPDGAYDLASASAKRGALAAVNGGYFHPDRTPLGLVVRQGVTIHPLERAKLLSGLVVVKKDRIAVLRAGEFKLSAEVREALQAGPFLVDGGKAVAGLDDNRSAGRTVVFADAAGNFGVLICRSTTLAETGRLLAAPGLLPAGKITRALNLDGGSSTALWVKREPSAFYSREWKGVRNYLAIVPRK